MTPSKKPPSSKQSLPKQPDRKPPAKKQLQGPSSCPLLLPPLKPPASVLFACDHNSVRSPIAAGILRHMVEPTVFVQSAGVRSGKKDPFVQTVMEEIGIDTSAHQPVAIRDLFDDSFDLVITLTPQAHHQALELTRTRSVDVVYWQTLDPTFVTGNRDQVLESYRSCRNALLDKIKNWFILEHSPDL